MGWPAPGWPAARGARLAYAAGEPVDLAAVRAHVAAACARAAPEARDALVLAADELCANVLAHAYAAPTGPLSVDVEVAVETDDAPEPADDGATRYRVTIVDAGPPFDPTAAPPPDLALPAERRPIGGLGLHLVRRSVDAFAYRRDGGRNVVTLEQRSITTRSTSHRVAPMQISIAQEGGVTVVAVAGSLDALTADALTAALQEQVRAGRTRLVASLAALEYTSSAGLRVLLGTLKEARQRGGDLRLAGAQERVRRVLDLSGFTSILKCYPDVPSAVASYPA